MATLAEYINENFPNPMDQDEFVWGGSRYTYDATPGIWTASVPQPEQVQNVATSAEEPTNPVEGDLWYDGEKLNVRAFNAWVDANPQPDAEDLDIVSTIVVRDTDTSVSDVNDLNFAVAAAPSGDGSVEVTAGATGRANVTITFPEVEMPTPDVPVQEDSSPANYVARRANMTAPVEWTNLTDAVSESITLNDLMNVRADMPTDDYVLGYDAGNEEWRPIPTSEGANAVSATGSTITVGGSTTQLNVVTNATLDDDGILTIARNDTTDLEVDLSGLGGEGIVSNVITVGGQTGVSTVNFSDNVTVAGSGGIATVTVPDYSVAVEANGTELEDAIATFDFIGDGVTLTDRGDGKIEVSIPGVTLDSTGVTNVDKQGNLVEAGNSVNKNQIVLKGGTGGTKHRVMIKNRNQTAQIKWTALAASVNALSLNGSDSWGIWQPQGPSILTTRESATAIPVAWPSNTNRTLNAGEVMFFEIDMPNNGTFTFDFSVNNINWSHAPLTQDTDSIAVVDVPADASMPAESDDIPIEGNAASTWTGLNYIPFSDTEEEGSDIIPWNIQTDDAFNRDLPLALFAEQVGGNGIDSPKSLGGNEYWGTDANGPRAGLWMESWGTTTTGNSTTPLNHGITVVMPRNDPDVADPVLDYLEMYANETNLWQSHAVTFMRDDSVINRLGSGNAGRIVSTSTWLPTDGANSGALAGFRSQSGPGNGPFSNQFSFSASSPNYFAGWDMARTHFRPEGSVGSANRHDWPRIAFNVPNDPDFGIIEIRRRGRPMVNDPLIGDVNVDNNGKVETYILSQSNRGDDFNHATVAPAVPGVNGALPERRIRVQTLRDDYSSVGAGGTPLPTLTRQRDNMTFFMRGIAGTTPDYGAGVTHSAASVTRIATALPTGNAQVEFDLRLDDDAVIMGIPELSASDAALIGLSTPPPGNSYYGPITLQREAPMCVISDTDSPNIGSGDNDYYVGRALLWQIEYRLRT